MRNANGRSRRQIPAATKLQILNEGRTTNTPVSLVCEHRAISPRLFHDWERLADQTPLEALNDEAKSCSPFTTKNHRLGPHVSHCSLSLILIGQ